MSRRASSSSALSLFTSLLSLPTSSFSFSTTSTRLAIFRSTANRQLQLSHMTIKRGTARTLKLDVLLVGLLLLGLAELAPQLPHAKERHHDNLSYQESI